MSWLSLPYQYLNLAQLGDKFFGFMSPCRDAPGGSMRG
jgi:hypothetical protein